MIEFLSSNVAQNIMLTLLVLLTAKVVFFVCLSLVHHKKDKKRSPTPFTMGGYFVTIIVPCYNEELTLENCVKSLLKQNYPNFEIIIVDDGSMDRTRDIGARLSLQFPNKISFISKINGGKARALNHGIKYANGDIVVCIDADSIFLKNTVSKLVAPFDDRMVGAVGGNVKVANSMNFIGGHQANEYMTGFNIQRRAFAEMNCMQVISGAVGAFRKKALIQIGGYSTDTIVEDMDVTISLVRAGYRVEYKGDAIAYTEAPESLSDFLKQRHRWMFGGFQVVKKHKEILFNKNHIRMGLIGLPMFIISPWIDVAVSFIFLFAIARVLFLETYLEFSIFFSINLIAQCLIFMIALKMDGGEGKRQFWPIFTGSLWYAHTISYISVKALIKFLVGAEVSWGKLTRLGKNVVPA